MNSLDWYIVVIVMGVISVMAYKTKKHTKGVADFLSANRCARRYMLAVAEGIASLGAIVIIAYFEMYYKAGFTMVFCNWMKWPVSFGLALSGFVIYRYRQTRCLTLGQFFEARYSKRFRLFGGIICYISGLLFFGIFPGIGSRFFVYYCGLPESTTFVGVTVPTFSVVMFILLAISLIFTFWGGQIAVVVTDLVQGIFCNVMFIVVVAFVLYKTDWSVIYETMSQRPEGSSLIDPFNSSNIKDFNFWFPVIASLGLIYNCMGWQSLQGYNSCAKNPHEARMGRILGNWRAMSVSVLLILVPVAAYTVMNNSSFSELSGQISDTVASIGNSKLKSQMITPIYISKILPSGLVGAFAAVVFAAFVTTHDSQLHSWGSIFVQDLIVPFQKKAMSSKRHFVYLRLSIIGVAVYAFVFSLFYSQTQHIHIFWQISSSVFLGGSGAVIIGGLYWKKGTTVAAYASMIVGAVLSITGFVLNQVFEDFFINGTWFYLIAMVGSSLTYIVVSLAGSHKSFDLDKLLHRGVHRIEGDSVADDSSVGGGRRTWLNRILGIGNEFSFVDKIIYFAVLFQCIVTFGIFCYFCIGHLFFNYPESSWFTFWKWYIRVFYSIAIIMTVWLSIGGFLNLKELFRDLKNSKSAENDDGRVLDN